MATAQLRLLVSFTPVPLQLSSPTASAAVSNTGYDSSSEALSSEAEGSDSSVQLSSEADTAPECIHSQIGHHRRPKQAPRRAAHQRPGRNKAGAVHKQLPRAAAADDTIPPAVTQLSDAPASSTTHLHDASPHSTYLVLEEQAASSANREENSTLKRAEAELQIAEGGVVHGMSPDQALSRLIQRAEELRQAIGAGAAEGWCPEQAPATLAPSSSQHASSSTAIPVVPGTSKSGGADLGSGNSTRAPETGSAAAGAAGQKRSGDRAAPVSKLRRIAENRLRKSAPGFRAIPSPAPQV